MRAAAKVQGLSLLMIETDAPFPAPVPHRGKTNEPVFLRHTAEYPAKMLSVSPEELATVTTANARSFYGFGSNTLEEGRRSRESARVVGFHYNG